MQIEASYNSLKQAEIDRLQAEINRLTIEKFGLEIDRLTADKLGVEVLLDKAYAADKTLASPYIQVLVDIRNDLINKINRFRRDQRILQKLVA